jgi:hypothetical protein
MNRTGEHVKFDNNDELRRMLHQGGADDAHLATPQFEFDADAFHGAALEVAAQHPDHSAEQTYARAAYRLLTSGPKQGSAPTGAPGESSAAATPAAQRGARIWRALVVAWGIAVLLLLGAIAAHAEPIPPPDPPTSPRRGLGGPSRPLPPAFARVTLMLQQPNGIILQVANQGTVLATRPAGLLQFNCSTNMSCSFSGTTFTLTASSSSGSAFNLITSCTNTSATMTVGTGATLTFSGSGVVNANQLQGQAVASTTPTNGQCLVFGTSWAPASCGGGGATFQVNGTNTSSQTTINWQSGTNIAVSNPSAGNVAFNITGQVGIANGGTGQSSANAAFNALSPMTTLGDTIYEDATPKAVRLAGSTSATTMFLSQTGNGTISAAPSWAQPGLSNLSGSLACGQTPALTGDTTTSAGSCATTTGKVNGVSHPANPSNHQVPVITASNTATYKTIPDCQDSSGNHLNYTQSSDAFSCGTTSSGGGGSGFKIESIQATPVTVSNTTSETNLMTFTLPASELGNNQALRLKATGVYSTASTAGNITLAVKVGATGGTTLCANTATALAASKSNLAWRLECTVIANAAPSASTATEAQGWADMSTSGTAANELGMPNTATVSWATNASQTIGVTVTFSVANASNSITERQLVAERLN